MSQGSSILFKVVNVNPFLYKPTINSTLYSFQAPKPALIDTTFPGTQKPTPAALCILDTGDGESAHDDMNCRQLHGPMFLF